MNNRIKLLRKKLKKTQKEFGEIIGLKQTSIADIEKGNVAIKDRNILLICSSFNVNEEWLRTGIGEMFVKKDSTSLDEYAKSKDLTPLELDIMRAYMDLDKNTRAQLLNGLANIFSKHDMLHNIPVVNSENSAVLDHELTRVKLEQESSNSQDTNPIAPEQQAL